MSKALVRICPACKTKNELSTFLCSKCRTNIVHVLPEIDFKKDRESGRKEAATVKTCLNCNFGNDPGDLICSKCSRPLDIVESAAKEHVANSKKNHDIEEAISYEREAQASGTVLEALCLVSKDSVTLQCKDGDILGREGTIMKEYFDRYKTVSRIHAKIILKDGIWHIVDLASGNGTFLNGVRMMPKHEYPLKAKDCLKLSSKLELYVK